MKGNRSKKQQAANCMKHRPRVPYLMIRTVSCNMQFDSRVNGYDKKGNQNQIREKNQFAFIHHHFIYQVRTPLPDRPTATSPRKV